MYQTKRGAESFLAATRADMERGTWITPDQGRIPLRSDTETWLAAEPDLRPRSREPYEIKLRWHILPTLGDTDLSKLSPSKVRSWHAALLAAGKPGVSTVAKCYRLLHAILAIALEDELIPKNPCVLRGASTDRSAERPVATVQQVYVIADAIGPDLRALVLFATFSGLRIGELRALKRSRLDLTKKTVEVVEQYQELSSGELVLGPPKTDAGRRTVANPDAIIPELKKHIAAYVGDGPDVLVFPGTQHQPLHRKTFYRNWNKATAEAGLPGFHFHDLLEAEQLIPQVEEPSTDGQQPRQLFEDHFERGQPRPR